MDNEFSRSNSNYNNSSNNNNKYNSNNSSSSSYSNNGDATKRFANAKSISSAQYFGNSNMSEVKFNKFYLEMSKLI